MADHEIVRMRIAPSEYSAEFAVIRGGCGYWYYVRMSRNGEFVADQWFAGNEPVSLPEWLEDETHWRQVAVSAMLEKLRDGS